jgi:osmotically-inducible protein OsmY
MNLKRLAAGLVLVLSLFVNAVAADQPSAKDNLINDEVRQKLAGDALVKGGAFDVDVKDGVVTLKGHVQDAKQKSKAESLAKKIKGVKSVVNNIQIVPQ